MADVNQAAAGESNELEENSDKKDDDTFGIAAGRIPDNALFSSSALNQACGASEARLNKQPCKEKYGAWSPMYNDKNQYLDIDLGDIVQVGAIATQGRPAYLEDGGWFVQSYSLAYGNDGDNFNNLREYGISKVFEGNTDAETVVKHQLKTAIKCRYLRIKPVTWHNQISLRVEVYKYTGTAPGPKKRQTAQRSAQKSSDRGSSRPNIRGNQAAPVIDIKAKVEKTPPVPTNDAFQVSVVASNKSQAVEEVAKEVAVADQLIDDNKGSMQVYINGQESQTKTTNVEARGSFEIVETAELKEGDGNESKASSLMGGAIETDVKSNTQEPNEQKWHHREMIPEVSVRNQAHLFQNRPSVDKVQPRLKQTEPVSKGNDGAKYIGKIKLVKKVEPPPEEESAEDEPSNKGPEIEIPDDVKERLHSFEDVVVRRTEKNSSENMSKRKSIILEEDLNYRNEMECSVFDRLRQFKESESKKKEDLQLKREEEEKRRSLKQDAEKRRTLAEQKEKERMLAILQKQKEEEEEKRRKQEEAESEEFLEIENEIDKPVVPAVVNDRLKLFKEGEKQQKEKQELKREEEEKRRSLKQDAEKRRTLAEQKEKERMLAILQKQKEEEEEKRRKQEEAESEEFLEIDNEIDKPVVPAVVNDRLKLFKEGEKQQKEKQEALKAEAERKRLAKENAEKKRIFAIQREKEKMQELMSKKQQEQELNKMANDTRTEADRHLDFIQDNAQEESEVPAIVHNRIRLFKDTEKANKERQEALRLEAKKRRALEEEAERNRLIAEERLKQESEEERHAGKTDIMEEEIAVVEENVMVESEMTFDFMDAPEETKESIGEPLQEENVECVMETDDNENEKEAIDFQERLKGIDTHHDGYDPDHERRMLEEAEEAFKSFAVHQKTGSKSKRSAKTDNLIKSFSVASSTPTDFPAKRNELKKTSPRSPLQTSKTVDEQIIPDVQQNVFEAPADDIEASSKVKETVDDREVVASGMVKNRANLFSKTKPPSSGERPESAQANVRKWIASHPSTNTARVSESHDSERVQLNVQLEEMDKRAGSLVEKMEDLKEQGDDEEALELEEDLNATRLEISKIKRKLLKLQKEQGQSKQLKRDSSIGSEPHSVQEEATSDRASSTGSRTPKGGSLKLSRECKAPFDKPPPPVDESSFNEDGEVVVEGSVFSHIKSYEKESTKQRKQRAEFRKSLSLSKSSLDSYENAPPMGFGGPEFAKDKSKLSRECKMQRDTPIPPVESEAYNDEGDCVPEGNVLQQVKAFSKS